MKKRNTIEDRLVSAKCKELVKSYFEVFDNVATEIVEELSGTILSKTNEGIALEYMRREGMKQGIKELLTRIHSKAEKQYGTN